MRRSTSLRIATGMFLCTPPFAAPAAAQRLAYAYRAGDSVAFIETLRLSARSTGRAGTVETTITRDARIMFAFVRPDSVRAWYDSLSIRASGAGNSRTINAREALRLGFSLSMTSDGVVKTLSIPSFPATLRDIGNFNPQFDDFIPMLPPIGATAGGTRTDTIVHRERQSDTRHSTIRRVVQSRYDRDTAVAGEPAVVIVQHATLHVERTSPLQGGAYQAKLVLDGTEDGIAIVTRTGRLLHRSRAGDTGGSIAYSAGGTDVSVPQRYRYQITLNAVR